MKLDQAINIEDLHRMAKRKLPKIIFDYIEGGVEDERGLDRNRAVAALFGRRIGAQPSG